MNAASGLASSYGNTPAPGHPRPSPHYVPQYALPIDYGFGNNRGPVQNSLALPRQPPVINNFTHGDNADDSQTDSQDQAARSTKMHNLGFNNYPTTNGKVSFVPKIMGVAHFERILQEERKQRAEEAASSSGPGSFPHHSHHAQMDLVRQGVDAIMDTSHVYDMRTEDGKKPPAVTNILNDTYEQEDIERIVYGLLVSYHYKP